VLASRRRCAFVQLSELFADTKQELEETSKELEETGKKLEQTTENLHVTTGRLRVMTQDRDEQKHLVGVHVNTEQKLHSQATQVSLAVYASLFHLLKSSSYSYLFKVREVYF